MQNWNAELIDIETAFLHGDMEELIFMDLPEGLNIIEGIDLSRDLYEKHKESIMNGADDEDDRNNEED